MKDTEKGQLYTPKFLELCFLKENSWSWKNVTLTLTPNGIGCLLQVLSVRGGYAKKVSCNTLRY